MSDSYYAGDPVALSTSTEGDMELECGNDPCRFEQSVTVEQEYSHGITEWYAYWTCSACGEANSRDGWFDPNDTN
jgi:hypothetical protein